MKHVTRALLIFWAIWFSVVVASNLADALLAAGLLAPGWPFASGNFSLVAESVSVYFASRAWAAFLFLLVLLLELAVALLFWRAALRPEEAGVLRAFFAAVVLFGGFLVADEVLLVYRRFPNLETGHFVILSALLLSLLSIRVLDQRSGAAR
jgi:hypothetical protein